ncbi:MAG: lipid-A-disaccharide synthase, partial [Pseudomonadota bacterium]
MRIVILAGEVSGDTLGAALMEAVSGRKTVEWHGIGGAAMTAAGFKPFFDMDEIEVNGFDAIVRRLPSHSTVLRPLTASISAA